MQTEDLVTFTASKFAFNVALFALKTFLPVEPKVDGEMMSVDPRFADQAREVLQLDEVQMWTSYEIRSSRPGEPLCDFDGVTPLRFWDRARQDILEAHQHARGNFDGNDLGQLTEYDFKCWKMFKSA